MIYIEYEYRMFIQSHGEAIEGAAGSALALAVVFRTVSRTVLRTIIRTSARAGMRASLKGALRAGIRAASRSQSVSFLKKGTKDSLGDDASQEEIRRANYKSLRFASLLLFISWVVVVGFGQPFASLMDAESARIKNELDMIDEDSQSNELKQKGIEAYDKQQAMIASSKKVRELKQNLKKNTAILTLEQEQELRDEITIATSEYVVAKEDLADALKKSRNKIIPPEADETEEAVGPVGRFISDFVEWLSSPAPFPGEPQMDEVITIKIDSITDINDVETKDVTLEYKIVPPALIAKNKDKAAEDSEPTTTAQSPFGFQVSLPSKTTLPNGEPNTNGEWSWVYLSRGILLEFPEKLSDFSGVKVEGSKQVIIENVLIEGNTLKVFVAGHTSWTSPVIWIGGLIMVIPLWVMFFAQSFSARKFGVILHHETGPIGGGIQLYFAGAFSFMPLTSDVIINTSKSVRGRIALWGITVLCLFALCFWLAWKITGNPFVLFIADAFLIYPMVQCFCLNPLEGYHVWKWRKSVWFLLFLFVMGLFSFVASEGLKNVI